jgi:CdiI immunity protein
MTTDWHQRPLELLMSVYFDEDWDLEGKTPTQLLESFRDDEPEPVVQRAYDQVVELLSQDLDDAELEQELHDRLGLRYYPPGDGLTHREWLEQVARALKYDRPTNGKAAP